MKRETRIINTRTRRAAASAGADALLAILDGPTANVFLEPNGHVGG